MIIVSGASSTGCPGSLQAGGRIDTHTNTQTKKISVIKHDILHINIMLVIMRYIAFVAQKVAKLLLSHRSTPKLK